MINVSFTAGEEGFRLKALGHANTAPMGRDLVCAAVSALVCTLAAALREAEEKGELLTLDIRLESGDAEILCKPKAAAEREVGAAFGFVEVGVEALCERYPHFVRVNSE